jgi:hypothetical protein
VNPTRIVFDADQFRWLSGEFLTVALRPKSKAGWTELDPNVLPGFLSFKGAPGRMLSFYAELCSFGGSAY